MVRRISGKIGLRSIFHSAVDNQKYDVVPHLRFLLVYLAYHPHYGDHMACAVLSICSSAVQLLRLRQPVMGGPRECANFMPRVRLREVVCCRELLATQRSNPADMLDHLGVLC